MNILMLIASGFVAVVFAGFAVILLKSGLQERLNRSCFLFITGFALWLILNYLSNITSFNNDSLLVINRTLFVVSAVEPFLIAGFVTDILRKNRYSGFFLWMSIFVLITAIISMTPLVVQGLITTNQSEASVGIVFGPLAPLYFLIIAIVVTNIFLNLYLGTKPPYEKRIRGSSKTLLLTVGFAVLVILVTNAIIPIMFGRFEFSTLGLLFGAFAIAGVSYSVVRHGLFDIRLAVVRSVTYTLVLITLGGLYVAIAFLSSTVLNNSAFSINQTFSGVVVSLLLAFLFQPIKRFFDRVTNRIFYKDNYNTDDFFAKLNKTLSTTTDLRGLLERVAYEIGTILKAEQAFFFIFTNSEGNYISAGTEGHRLLPKHDAVLFEQKTKGEADVFVASMFDDNDPVRRMMVSHRIELVLPLIQDDAVIGYLCLGDHKTSNYTNRDIKALNTISDELIIAIQNALAVHEIRELNASLQQKIANATKELRSSNAVLRRLDEIKDEFISMASHQLRTPLTSVKGYISMVIEGDVGKITPSQKQLLEQAFMSSENMVHLINDFLNVSRLQSGKFVIDKTDVDLSKLVEEEMNGLRPNATARGMKLVYKKPNKFPIVQIDEGKFRQVVMNFADNAIYYSHENSSIIVSLGVEGNEIVFTVKDTGIGVPKAEQDKLFAKFYRAANAKVQRPDGTGVGIFLAKKVVDAHGGTIIFDSVEGKGSTFGFRLPLPPKQIT
jgi:signal transduction histidine kinase